LQLVVSIWWDVRSWLLLTGLSSTRSSTVLHSKQAEEVARGLHLLAHIGFRIT
jgi:hypothetical protein